jgi:hypothetical protein
LSTLSFYSETVQIESESIKVITELINCCILSVGGIEANKILSKNLIATMMMTSVVADFGGENDGLWIFAVIFFSMFTESIVFHLAKYV